jgi:uncharacterized circularly permuted ATP-grasp superfamily protein
MVTSKINLGLQKYNEAKKNMSIDWKNYQTEGLYDELIVKSDEIRPSALALCNYLNSLNDTEIKDRSEAAELAIRVMGITFTVYSEGSNIDRVWPFDIIPRIIDKQEWEKNRGGT